MPKIRATIQFKILATTAALLLAGSVVLAVATRKVATQVSTHIGETMMGAAEGVSDRLCRTMFERYGDVQAFALNRVAHDPANWGKFDESNPLIATMNDYTKTYGIYSLTILVDTKGNVVAVNTRDPSGSIIDTSPIRARNYSDAIWFKNAIAGKFFEGPGTTITGTVIDDIHFNEDVKTIYKKDGEAIAFSAPVKNDKGEVIGVWHNIADFSFIEEILCNAVGHEREAGNPTAEVILVGKDGVLWAEANTSTITGSELRRDTDLIGKLNLIDKGYAPATSVLQGKSGFSLCEKHCRSDKRQSIGYAFRDPNLGFGGMPWGVLVRVDADEAMRLQTAIQSTVLWGTAGSIGVCLIGSFFAVRFFMRPIKVAVARMDDISSGNGDLTQRMDDSRTDETGDLARSFNTFVEKMRNVVGEVMDSAGEVAATSTQISAGTESLAAGVSEQQARTTRISAAVDQSSASVGEVARRSNEATQFAERAGQEAINGGSEVNGAIQSIERVASDVELAAKAIADLGVKSEQIGQIIGVINDIAEQTNLLALNAAIEAARAGEHGRGFAVVADEVRKLAERTQRATGEISQSIKTIQHETSHAVDRMKVGSDQVHGSVEQARRAGATLERIVTSSKDVATMVRGIAATAEQQAQATEEISKAVGEIASITAKFSESTTETSSATTLLSQKAEFLRKLVERFKIERRTDSSRVGGEGITASGNRVLDISRTGVRLEVPADSSLDQKPSTLDIQGSEGFAHASATPMWSKRTSAGKEIGLHLKDHSGNIDAFVRNPKRKPARKS